MTWEIGVMLGLMALALFMGGYIGKLLKEIREFCDVVIQAMEDGQIDSLEVAQIIKESKDVKEATIEIARFIMQIRHRQ